MHYNLSPEQLLRVAQYLVKRHPDVILVKNAVGNLAMVDHGEYIGYVDLTEGKVNVDGEG